MIDQSIILNPGESGFDRCAVKDPSIVKYKDKHYIVYTAIDDKPTPEEKVSLGFVYAGALSDIQKSPRINLNAMWDMEGLYLGAPQIFFNSCDQHWYIVAQRLNKEGEPKYLPVFSRNRNIEDPTGWSKPKDMAGPEIFSDTSVIIDFWVILDREKNVMRLFYTDQQANVWCQETTREDFPYGWHNPQKVLHDACDKWELHEASHIYRIEETGSYFMIVECRRYGEFEDYINRFMQGYVSESLVGPWRSLADTSETPWFERDCVFSNSGLRAGINQVSHCEYIRSNCDESMSIPATAPVIIQETIQPIPENSYIEIEWRLRQLDWSEKSSINLLHA